MRILQVTHYMPPHSGGIERVAAAIGAGLRGRGHEVHWIASATPLPPSSADQESRVPAWNLLEERWSVPFPIWSPRALRVVRERVAWADVVLAHDCLYVGTSIAASACGAQRKPLVLTQHVGYVPYGRMLDAVQGLAYRTLGTWNLSRAAELVACSPHVPEFFARLGLRRKFRIIPNAVAVDRFYPADPLRRAEARKRFGIPEQARVLLFVGRLVPKKAVPRVVHVQKELAAQGTTLLVVGDGPLRGALASAPGVVHLPHVAPESMPDVYAAGDLLVLPSRGEGLPVSAQEALLSGLPLVASDDPAFVSNLTGAPGVRIARDDAGLVSGARGLLESPPAPGDVAAWARQRWTEERFLDSYEEVLSSASASTAKL